MQKNEDDDKLEKIIGEAEKDEEEKNQANALVNLILNGKSKLFFDQFKKTFIAVDGNGRKVLRLGSREFKRWLSYLGWQTLKKAVSSATVETALRTLEGHALHEGEEIKLQVRIADLGDKICYDLGDGRSVEINKDEWKILETSPILFYRFSHQEPQVAPIQNEDLGKIYDYIPCPTDPGQKLLLSVWLVAAMLPNFPHPILVVHGPQGSRKTTLSKLLRKLIDPSVTETLTSKGDHNQFIQLASHHYLLPLDNLSVIDSDFSDTLCRTVTGEGMSKRELFTDDEDVIYSFRRVISLNGINLVVSKPDLLERSLIIELERPVVYEEESKLLKRFEKERPYLLGSLFGAVQQSLNKFEDIALPTNIGSFRMADFVRWGCAISKALGHTAEEFMQALANNLADQNAQAIEESTVAQVVMSFMKDKPEYKNTPTDLLQELTETALSLNFNIKHKYFPQTPNWLWRRLETVATNLLSLGVKVVRSKEGARLITLTKTDKYAVNAVLGVQETEVGVDVTGEKSDKDSVEGVPF